MGRYDRFDRQPLPSWRRRWEEAHPLWGPLGCLFAILVVVLSYALAVLTLQNRAARLWLLASPLLRFHGLPPYLMAKILLTLVYGVLLYGLLGLIYAVLLHIFGATLDMPWDLRAPVRRHKRRLLHLLEKLTPLFALGMTLWSVPWMKHQSWYRPIPALRVPGPVPDLLLYVLAFILWDYLFEAFVLLLNGLLLALLKMLSKTSTDEDER